MASSLLQIWFLPLFDKQRSPINKYDEAVEKLVYKALG